MALKEEREVLNEIEEKDQYENLNDFLTGEKSFCSLQSGNTYEKELKRQELGIVLLAFSVERLSVNKENLTGT